MERKLISEADSRPLVVIDPRAPSSPDALDAAVRAAGSLAVHFARKTGCSLLLPGDRRASVIEHDLLAWPALHVRLALLDDHAGPSLAAAQNRRGLVIYVAARPVDRAPRGLGRTPGGCLVVVPGTIGQPPRDARGRGLPRLRRPAARAAPPRSRRWRARREREARGLSPAPPRARTRSRRADARAAARGPSRRRGPPGGARCCRSRSRARWRSRRSRRGARCTGCRCSSRPSPARLDWSCSSGCSRSPRCSPPGGSRAAGAARRRRLDRPLAALMLLAGRVADELLLPGGWERAGRGDRARDLRPARRARALPRSRRLGPHRDPARRQRARPARRAARVLAARGRLGFPASRCWCCRALRRAGRRARLHRRVPPRRRLHAADGRVPAAREAAPAGRARGGRLAI